MRRFLLGGGATILVGIALCLTAWGAAAPQQHGAGWEYKMEEQPSYVNDYEKMLNDLGKQGWEYCDTRQLMRLDEVDKTVRPVAVVILKRPANFAVDKPVNPNP